MRCAAPSPARAGPGAVPVGGADTVSIQFSEHVIGVDESSDELEERLAVVNRKLKSARGKLARKTADARQEWERDVRKLAKLRDGFQEKLVELRKQGAKVSEKTRQQLENAWDEASELLHRLDGRVKKPGNGPADTENP